MTEKQWDSPPTMQIDPQKTYRVTIETNRGDMELELYPEYAPKTVNNFVFLAQEGFYDGSAEARDSSYLHGERRAEHEREPVFHHAFTSAALGWYAYCIRQSGRGTGNCERHSTGG
jgi:hypothetical protein